MRKINALICMLALLAVAGCGGKDEAKDKKTGNTETIPPNTKLVKLELPGMT